MKKNATAEYGITRYSDLTSDEFLGPHLMTKNATHAVREQMTNIKYEPFIVSPKQALINLTIGANGAIANEILGESYQSFYDPKLMKKNLNFLPLHVDWRDENVLLPVRKQGKCGACWAYSVLATIEANRAIRTGNKTRLSVQQMIDCAKNGNNGCAGGDTCMLFEWLAENRVPIHTEDEYPLTNEDKNMTCKVDNTVTATQSKQLARIDDFVCRRYMQ